MRKQVILSKIQWWDRHGIAITDILAPKGGKWHATVCYSFGRVH
jgi:hypothetical protein